MNQSHFFKVNFARVFDRQHFAAFCIKVKAIVVVFQANIDGDLSRTLYQGAHSCSFLGNFDRLGINYYLLDVLEYNFFETKVTFLK